MRNRLLLLCLLTASISILTLLPAHGSPDSHAEVLEDMLAAMNEFNAAAAGIDDDASAKAAEGKLEEALDRFQSVLARMDNLDDPGPELEAELMERYGQELEEVMSDFIGHAFRVGMDPRIDIEIDIEESMTSIEGAFPSGAGGTHRGMTKAEAARRVAKLDQEWVAIEADRRALADQRSELAELQARQGADLREVEDLEHQVEAMAYSFTQEVVDFANKTIDLAAETEEVPEIHARVMELQAASIRMKSDEDILIAQEYIDQGGDYRRAIEIYQAALRIDPDYARLQEALASAEANRYMTEERFAQVEKGMTRDEVREALGPVNRNLIQEYPDRNVIAWFYPKGAGAGAAGIYFEGEKGVYRVYQFDFNAVESP